MEQGTYRRAVLLSEDELQLIIQILRAHYGYSYAPINKLVAMLEQQLVEPGHNGTDLCP